MNIDAFRVRGSELDRKIEELVSKRLNGEWADADQLELDRLVALRAVQMLPSRIPMRRFA